MPRSARRPRAVPALLVVALGLAACTGTSSSEDASGEAAGEEGIVEEDAPDERGPSEDDLAVSVASYDLAVGDERRLLAGVANAQQELLAFGEVSFELGYLGEETGGEADLTQQATASFLPVPGDVPEGETRQPSLLDGDGTGVYEGEVEFDRAGNWGLRVTAELADGSTREGQTVFRVAEQQQVPAEGDDAPEVDNLTIADIESGEAEPIAVDSRAQGADDEVPDEALHDLTVAEAIEQGRPAVVLLSTPVYCVSRFCGPITEAFAELEQEYRDRAEVIHIEVWRDFEEQELNEAAAPWIQTETGGNEPWAFLVDDQGEIAARWDNVVDLEALEAELDKLPASPGEEGEG